MDVIDPPEPGEPGIDGLGRSSLEPPVLVERERRSAPRRKLALVVHLSFPSVDAVFESETVDLSRSGAFLHTTEIRPAGTPVRLSIAVQGRTLVLHGVVVRTTQPPVGAPGLGIGFHRAVADDSGLFDELLATKWLRATSRGAAASRHPPFSS